MSQKRTTSIGIFDSGFGGLRIMRGIVNTLPEYNFIYLGDTARVPYGTRSPEIVYKFTKQAIEFLFSKNCSLIILACNTASSDALHKIQESGFLRKYPGKKVLGVIIPTAEYSAIKTKNKKIGVIATKTTVTSNAFTHELQKLDRDIQVFQNACPLLVPLIESGEHRSKATDFFLQKYLKPLLAKKIDTLILGCTHYDILKQKIKTVTGKNVHVVSEVNIVAQKLKIYLKKHSEIERALRKDNQQLFYSTDITDNFQILGSKFFGSKITPKKATLKE